ncbi:SDR family oxidoreductase [Leptolyngbya sp. NIES-2104]|uniref:SDR family oxidoreductase n=1 Tax=Leptolyngbya sp. NIES-2104 TaxID=1552121 RepID=UPI0006ECC7FC|nr:NmrA family NAD(P)-binding protein [Leptolyngbya sp. NIES-2104]GAP96855.1 nucleoside-diphosphate-sugar epimerase [Leptolyngbya sp. NIES-2104]
MKVLMVGATGQYASLVLPELKQRGATVRALVRDERKSNAARQQGAEETAIADLNDSDSLRAAATGVDGVFHINPAFTSNEAELGVAMVEAAKAAGVQKFVFSGAIHPSISKMSNHAAKRSVEEALYESGMEFTVLQPTMFMQTLDNGWNAVIAQGRFSLPYSKSAKASYVDYRDVAEVAALALTGNRLGYGTFELCAPGMVNRVELAAMMSEAIGSTIEAGEPSFDEWAQAAHIPEGSRREGMRTMYADYDQHGFPGGNALVLQAILEREPRTLRQYIQELANRKVAS